MCLVPDMPAAVQQPLPPPPIRASEEVSAAASDALRRARKRPGTAGTEITSGLGDKAYGQAITRTTLGGL